MTAVIDVLARLDIFSGLSKAERNKIRKLMSQITLPAGKTFISEGDAGLEAFIILSGRGTVRRGGRVVASIGPGDVVGEMAVVASIPRTASVTADTDIEAEVLNRREFLSLIDQNPSIAKKIMIGALHRLHELAPSITG